MSVSSSFTTVVRQGSAFSQSQKEKEKILLAHYLTGLIFNLQQGLFKRTSPYRGNHTLSVLNPFPQIRTMITLPTFQAREHPGRHRIMFNSGSECSHFQLGFLFSERYDS